MPLRITSNTIRVDRINIRYLKGGTGEPVIILHGGSNGADTWRKNAAALSKDHTVYVPDLPGFGDSEPLGEGFDYSSFVGFVNSFATAMGLDSFSLVGHSMGGCIAMQYALKYPGKVKKLVLVSSLGLGTSIAAWIRYLSSPLFMSWIAEPVLAAVGAIKWAAGKLSRPIRWVNSPLTRMNISLGRGIASMKGQTIVLRDRLSELVMPTLVVWGERDGVVPVRHAYAAAELIPHCQLQVLSGGHSIHRQRMEEFSETVSHFLERE